MYEFSSIEAPNRKSFNSSKKEIINKNNRLINIQKNLAKIQQNHLQNKLIIFNFLCNNKCSNFSEKFELLNYINSGSSGIVFKGFDKKNPSYYLSFKFLINNIRKNKKNTIKKRTLKEIIIHNKLKSHNIINYYNYVYLKDIGCIVMEYAELGDLEHFQKFVKPKRHFSESFLVFITFQILQGLFYLNKSKIIHMDIKPQNLLIDKNLNIKITDFSAAFSFENYRKNQKILLPFSGTSLYMSPEVLSNDYIDYDECNKVDLYSLGVVLYFLAFDKFPYKLDLSYNLNFSLILKEIKNNKLSFPETEIYSKLFLKFINKLLEKDIKNRFNIYDALNDPWIRGAELLFREKEKIDDTEIFLINIITDNFRCFNEYINSF